MHRQKMTGLLSCPRCRAKVETDSIEKGRILLDHAIGLHIGKPCYDGLVELVFTGKNVDTKVVTKVDTKSKTDVKHSNNKNTKL